MDNNSRTDSPLLRWLFGLPFTLAGLLIIVSALSGTLDSSSDAINESPFLGALAGLLFLIPGLRALQVDRFIKVNLPGTPETRSMLFFGFLVLLMGSFIIIMSFVDNDEAFSAPRWLAALAGAVFALVGAYMVKTAIFDQGRGDEKSFLSTLFITLLFTCFGSIVTWISLGAGERRFEGSMTLLFVTLPVDTSEVLGRLCFLPGAVILDIGAAAGWVVVIRRLIHAVREAIRHPGAERRTLLTTGVVLLLLALTALVIAVAQRIYYFSLPR